MGKETKIAWADATVNFWTGCTKVAPECANCYAERDMSRYGKDFRKLVRTQDPTFYAPLQYWRQPKKVFVESWGDFFHEGVPEQWRTDAWSVIRDANWHTYIIPTKRPELIPQMLPNARWGWPEKFQHVWFLVSAGTNESLARFWPVLRDVPDLAVRGISMEPLLEDIVWAGIHDVKPSWVIVAGESGPNRRPMDPTWARHIRDDCAEWGIPFFYKGLVGNVHTPENELLDGRAWHEFPKGR